MKSTGVILLIFCAFLSVNAQECPPEWVKYTFGGYFYNIQSDHKNVHQTETEFKNNLLNMARANLAKQIKVTVHDSAEIKKTAVDGRSALIYSSNTKFSTDLNMKLVDTKTLYNPDSREGCAIAYIDRDAAHNFYKNELTLAYNKINNSIMIANNYLATGFKRKAQSELDSILKYLDSVDESLFWLNIFGVTQSELSDWQAIFNHAEQDIKCKLAELKHANVIYLSCSADIFGKSYPILQNELKGVLSSEGCSFTDNPLEADWDIRITCSAQEYNTVRIGNVSSYLSYVNAYVSIDKVYSSQRIYEDEVSCKGGHNFSYSDAARIAYDEIKETLEKNIKNYILQ